MLARSASSFDMPLSTRAERTAAMRAEAPRASSTVKACPAALAGVVHQLHGAASGFGDHCPLAGNSCDLLVIVFGDGVTCNERVDLQHVDRLIGDLGLDRLDDRHGNLDAVPLLPRDDDVDLAARVYKEPIADIVRADPVVNSGRSESASQLVLGIFEVDLPDPKLPCGLFAESARPVTIASPSATIRELLP